MRETIRKRETMCVCARESKTLRVRERDRETMKMQDFDSIKTVRERNWQREAKVTIGKKKDSERRQRDFKGERD